MKLNVDFSALHQAVKLMGAKIKKIELNSDNLPALDPIDVELKKGIEVNIEEIEFRDNGLLSYKDRQVLLYIQDHGWNIKTALQDGSKGKKYHVAYCNTLENMYSRGRYNRYVVKNDISGKFYIDGKDNTGEYSGETNLCICKNCLSHLNYKDYSNALYIEKNKIFDSFLLEDFFNEYQSYFKHKPKYYAGEKKSNYSNDWSDKSLSYRNSIGWKCDKCQINLMDNKELLHTHHVNGVKHDNSLVNLKALCIVCHSNEPSHSHMKVENHQKQIIYKLRNIANKRIELSSRY